MGKKEGEKGKGLLREMRETAATGVSLIILRKDGRRLGSWM